MRVNLVKEKIKEVLPKTDGAKTEGMLDLIIAFDTTGSMKSYIGAVKKHVTKLIPKLFESNPNLKIGYNFKNLSALNIDAFVSSKTNCTSSFIPYLFCRKNKNYFVYL